MSYSRIQAQAFSEANGDLPNANVERSEREIVVPVHQTHPHAKRWFIGLSVVTIAAVFGGWFVFLRGQLHNLVRAVPATAQSFDFLGEAAGNVQVIGSDTFAEAEAGLAPETQAVLHELQVATERTMMIGNVLDSVTEQINAETYAEEEKNPTTEITD